VPLSANSFEPRDTIQQIKDSLKNTDVSFDPYRLERNRAMLKSNNTDKSVKHSSEMQMKLSQISQKEIKSPYLSSMKNPIESDT
jgi:hypothetical protein